MWSTNHNHSIWVSYTFWDHVINCILKCIKLPEISMQYSSNYSINTYSLDWLPSRFLHNYVLYHYMVFTICFGIQKLRSFILYARWPQSQMYSTFREKGIWVLSALILALFHPSNSPLANDIKQNLVIKGEGHKEVTKCKKLKFSILLL